jgi:hypothetical protein
MYSYTHTHTYAYVCVYVKDFRMNTYAYARYVKHAHARTHSRTHARTHAHTHIHTRGLDGYMGVGVRVYTDIQNLVGIGTPRSIGRIDIVLGWQEERACPHQQCESKAFGNQLLAFVQVE